MGNYARAVGAQKRRTRQLQDQKKKAAPTKEPPKEAPYERLLRKLREDQKAG